MEGPDGGGPGNRRGTLGWHKGLTAGEPHMTWARQLFSTKLAWDERGAQWHAVNTIKEVFGGVCSGFYSLTAMIQEISQLQSVSQANLMWMWSQKAPVDADIILNVGQYSKLQFYWWWSAPPEVTSDPNVRWWCPLRQVDVCIYLQRNSDCFRDFLQTL